jgi:hypothetical protein
MSNDNVTVLGTRLERWSTAFETEHRDRGAIRIKVSNHGRLLIGIGSENCILACTDMVQAVQGIIRELANQGFSPDPPPDGDDPVYMKVR